MRFCGHRLCVLLLSKDIPQHEPYRETFRQHAQERGSLSDRVQFAYVYEDSQSDFVQSLTLGKGVINGSLGTLKVRLSMALRSVTYKLEQFIVLQ